MHFVKSYLNLRFKYLLGIWSAWIYFKCIYFLIIWMLATKKNQKTKNKTKQTNQKYQNITTIRMSISSRIQVCLA